MSSFFHVAERMRSQLIWCSFNPFSPQAGEIGKKTPPPHTVLPFQHHSSLEIGVFTSSLGPSLKANLREKQTRIAFR